MKFFLKTIRYIRHFISARHTWGFGVHSPFIYSFISFVLNEKHPFYVFQSIEDIRCDLLRNKDLVEIKDCGTGEDRFESIANIASKSLKSPKYGQLLFRMVHYFKAVNVLELGTCLGVTTLYLATPSSKVHCITLEGSERLAAIAREIIETTEMTNVSVVVGNIDETLPNVLRTTEKLDFVLFDANHRYEAVMTYLEQCLPKIHGSSVFVIDDIYWSAGMEKAWKEIKAHPMVTATIDLYQIGIVFFNQELHNKHYKMRY